MHWLWVAARRLFLVVGAVVVAVAALYGLLVPFTDLIAGRDVEALRGKERFDALTSTRQLVLAAVGGVLASIGVVVTARTYTANKRGQVTDRYGKAVALLASDKLDERLGGLYALEHVMRESPTDHGAVVEVLLAFVREHSAERVRHRDGDPARGVVGPDIQVAVDIIGRRPWRRDTTALDFSGARLPGADLTSARLDRAVFSGTDLDGARFENAALAGARFRGCSAARADFSTARLAHAEFTDAVLTGAVFESTSLSGTRFTKCDLRRSRWRVRADSTVVLRGCTLTEVDWAGHARWMAIDQQDNEVDESATAYFTKVRRAIHRREEERDRDHHYSFGDL